MTNPTQNNNIFPSLEAEVSKFWAQAQTFAKSVAKDAPRGDYVFYDGPPFATGEPHYGHIVGSVMKDAVPRYWTMNGFRVERKWGWDCHGLPIENIAEKELGITRKKDIETMGVDKFNEFCRSKVLDYVDYWKNFIPRLGRWADMENSYKTMDLDYMESIWWVFKQLWDQGLIYESHRSMHICPRCETTLSQSEVAEGYRDIKDLSVTAKFELVDEPGTFVLAWTTTPWTLIGNVALAVNPEIDYIKAKCVAKEDEDEYIILAKERWETIDEEEYKIVKTFKGQELVGKKYVPIFDYYANQTDLVNRDNGWKIYAADFVTTTDGSGIVHIAPAFGDEDMKLGQKENLPFVQHVGMDGVIKPEAIDFAGLHVKPKDDHQKTDVEVIKSLAHQGKLFDKEQYGHSYPHCWRCDTPLINYATSSWFVKVTDLKPKALELAQDINWSPAHIKEGRFGNWLEGARDWSISRQRFWASVMPIWKCNCGETKVFGSVKELEELSGQKVTDLHKHIVDQITIPCEKCGDIMHRVPDVLDTWFDSGSMPYAQMHYPFENKEKFEANFPAAFIAEGVDQTRCWFYYLHVLATGVKQSLAYKNVIVNGIVAAEDGKKMSKRLKNYPDPILVLDKYGADALRIYLLQSSVMTAENLNFSEKGVMESLQKNIMLLWNVYKFYEMFADNYQLAISDNQLTKTNNILDQWILAKLNNLIAEVTKQMEAYDLPRATRPITEFINDLSTWYLRRSRDRFKSDDETDKQAALTTTKFVLTELAKVMAPFTPFVAEQLWQKMTGHNFANANQSVHLEKWPNQLKISNEQLSIISDMELVQKVVELGLAKRDEARIKVRQPLQKLIISNYQLTIEYEELIKDELNIKEIKCNTGDGEISVELDTEITEDLKLEGLKRELVRLINNLRKDANLTINERAIIYIETADKTINEALAKFQTEILADTLSTQLGDKITEAEFTKAAKIDQVALNIGIKKS